MRIAVGVSTAPEPRKAAAEAAAHARDELAGEAPTLAVLLASQSHTGKAVDVLDAVQRTVEAPALIGCVAQAIVAGAGRSRTSPRWRCGWRPDWPPKRSRWASSAPARVG